MRAARQPSQPGNRDKARARRDAIAWATAVARDPRTIYLDTETTGLDGTAQIIEISVVDGAGRVLLDTLVRPTAPIPAEARAVHGITDDMVRDAPQWPAIHAALDGILPGSLVVVYNADFDARIISQMNARHGVPARVTYWHCAMQQYAAYAGVWHERYGNYRWHRLDDALSSFGHPPGGHRALSDALSCKLVVEGMASAG